MVVSSSLSTIVGTPTVQAPVSIDTLNGMRLNSSEDSPNKKEEEENEEPLKKRRKPRAKKVNKLSKEEVRQNHVSSEKKRRELVRTIYDDLVKMIPDLQPNENRSEMVIYMKTINHLNWLYRNNRRLRKQLEKKNKELGKDDYRIPENLVWELKSTSGDGLENHKNLNNDNVYDDNGLNTTNEDTDTDNTNAIKNSGNKSYSDNR